MLKLRTAAVAAAAAMTLAMPLTPTHADDQSAWQTLETTSARLDNPLKGFVPFGAKSGDPATIFPHTMEWFYMPLKAVVKGERTYDWSALETQLEGIKSRGNQAALRFYLDYPKEPTGVPDYLLGEGGIDQSRKRPENPEEEREDPSFSPDYDDPRIQALITDFTKAFGEKYDGDPRIGFITTGLVGFWGEQHTWPMNGHVHEELNPTGANWMPSREVELNYYRVWDEAFDKTRLLNRYPNAEVAGIDVGFHDDSFAVSTLPTIDWHFLSLMDRAGMNDHWQSHPIGGEIQPPVQTCLFDLTAECKDNVVAENFDEAVQASHVSWLMNETAWKDGGYTGDALVRAKAAHASLGYDFAATHVNLSTQGNTVTVSLKVTNRGVAPFYYDWPVEFAILGADGKPAVTKQLDVDLPTLLPGQTAEWTTTLEARPGTVAVRIPNVMEGGAPIRFANTAQDATADGYLTLGTVTRASSGNQGAGGLSSMTSPTGTKPMTRPGLPRTGSLTRS